MSDSEKRLPAGAKLGRVKDVRSGLLILAPRILTQMDHILRRRQKYNPPQVPSHTTRGEVHEGYTWCHTMPLTFSVEITPLNISQNLGVKQLGC